MARGELAAGRRIMGMGHRIYRVRDPRAAVLEHAASALEQSASQADACARARRRARGRADSCASGIPIGRSRANVEFYTAVLLDAVGLPRALFSPTFAASRVAAGARTSSSSARRPAHPARLEIHRATATGMTKLRVAAAFVIAATAAVTAQVPASLALLELKPATGNQITVRISAPQVTDLRAFVDTMAATDAKPLAKDKSGIWTGTLGPFAPDIYSVSIVADTVVRPIGYVHLAGTTPEAWDPRKVPHGTIQQHWYDSRSLGVSAACSSTRHRLTSAARRHIRCCICCMAAAAWKDRGFSTGSRT